MKAYTSDVLNRIQHMTSEIIDYAETNSITPLPQVFDSMRHIVENIESYDGEDANAETVSDAIRRDWENCVRSYAGLAAFYFLDRDAAKQKRLNDDFAEMVHSLDQTIGQKS